MTRRVKKTLCSSFFAPSAFLLRSVLFLHHSTPPPLQTKVRLLHFKGPRLIARAPRHRRCWESRARLGNEGIEKKLTGVLLLLEKTLPFTRRFCLFLFFPPNPTKETPGALCPGGGMRACVCVCERESRGFEERLGAESKMCFFSSKRARRTKNVKTFLNPLAAFSQVSFSYYFSLHSLLYILPLSISSSRCWPQKCPTRP